MELQIVNPRPKYRPATLTGPPLLGYIHTGAVAAPPGRGPFPPRSAKRTALLARLKTLAAQLEGLGTVQKATVYRAVLVPPVGGEARRRGARPARFDVAVLIETTRPEVIDEVQGTEPYKLLLEALADAAEDVHVMAARCPKRTGDVDKTRPGLLRTSSGTTWPAGTPSRPSWTTPRCWSRSATRTTSSSTTRAGTTACPRSCGTR